MSIALHFFDSEAFFKGWRCRSQATVGRGWWTIGVRADYPISETVMKAVTCAVIAAPIGYGCYWFWYWYPNTEIKWLRYYEWFLNKYDKTVYCQKGVSDFTLDEFLENSCDSPFSLGVRDCNSCLDYIDYLLKHSNRFTAYQGIRKAVDYLQKIRQNVAKSRVYLMKHPHYASEQLQATINNAANRIAVSQYR